MLAHYLKSSTYNLHYLSLLNRTNMRTNNERVEFETITIIIYIVWHCRPVKWRCTMSRYDALLGLALFKHVSSHWHHWIHVRLNVFFFKKKSHMTYVLPIRWQRQCLSIQTRSKNEVNRLSSIMLFCCLRISQNDLSDCKSDIQNVATPTRHH